MSAQTSWHQKRQRGLCREPRGLGRDRHTATDFDSWRGARLRALCELPANLEARGRGARRFSLCMSTRTWCTGVRCGTNAAMWQLICVEPGDACAPRAGTACSSCMRTKGAKWSCGRGSTCSWTPLCLSKCASGQHRVSCSQVTQCSGAGMCLTRTSVQIARAGLCVGSISQCESNFILSRIRIQCLCFTTGRCLRKPCHGLTTDTWRIAWCVSCFFRRAPSVKTRPGKIACASLTHKVTDVEVCPVPGSWFRARWSKVTGATDRPAPGSAHGGAR